MPLIAAAALFLPPTATASFSPPTAIASFSPSTVAASFSPRLASTVDGALLLPSTASFSSLFSKNALLYSQNSQLTASYTKHPVDIL
ncbi:hypothetical protein L2E82_06016 [Cichorium intybus]|uniref:Uncharacterized protein n=1 Tax=Cichorium intybus TaxID=13427 RepID=A0ACB9HA79_CICIN|nr:hypothetical protein L2E82_06016 [Cichorium intybus]